MQYTDPTGNCPLCIAAIGGAVINGLINYGTQIYQNQQLGYRGWDAFTHICVDELLIAMAAGAGMGATAALLTPVLAPVAALGPAGAFFAFATEGAITNSVGQVITNVLSGRGWNVGLAQAYRDGYVFGGVLGLTGKVIKTWWQAAHAQPLGIVAPGFGREGPSIPDLYQLPAGLKPSDLIRRTWQYVDRKLMALGAERIPSKIPGYENDKIWRWLDSSTNAIWEVRYHLGRSKFPGPGGSGYTIKFGRQLLDLGNFTDASLSDDLVRELDNTVRVILGSEGRGNIRPLPIPKFGIATEWVDFKGWLYYGEDFLPAGRVSDISHIRGAWNRYKYPGE